MSRPAAPATAATLVLLAALAGCAAAPPPAERDPVVLRFATVGDSRQDPVGPDPTQVDPATGRLTGQDAHWLQNTRALARILREVGAERASLLFFNGDLIMGYGRATVPPGWAGSPPSDAQLARADLPRLMAQYAFWRGMVAPTLEAGTYVVPVAGNHELQCNGAAQSDPYNQAGCPAGKHSQVENEAAWAANMGDLILDADRFQALFGARPTAASFASEVPGLDGQAADQSTLTFSFDFRGAHFAVLNTDAAGTDAAGRPLDSHAPTRWLARDLAAAAARGNTHFFVFGHKQAWTYDHSGRGTVHDGGLDADPAARDAFWAVIEQYGATYFCGHEHTNRILRPHGGAYQVLAGSGGSPFAVAPGAASAHPQSDRHYAWASVDVHRSGTVTVRLRGFSDHFGPTEVLQTVELPR